MHFWIDKRSSQLHNYGGAGRGRPPGSGGFYSRTFGSRHHPPLNLRSSNSTSSSHGPFRHPTQNPSSNSSAPSPNPNPSLSAQSSSSSSVASSQQNTSQQHQQHPQQQNPSSCVDSFLNNSSVQCPSSSSSSNTNRCLFRTSGTDAYNHLHHHQPHQQDQFIGFPNNPNSQMATSGVPTNANHLCEGSAASGANNYGGMMAEGTHQQHLPCQHVIRILSGDTNSTHLRFSSPFLRGGLGGGGYPPSRRPRSQVQGSQIISVGRRRSSGGANNSGNGNTTNPNGTSRRTSSGTNRWSYDPYNLHQNRSSIHHHAPVHLVDSRSRSEWSNIPTPTSPETATGLSSPISISNSGELHNPIAGMNPSNHTTLIPRELQGSTSTNNSLVDPAWKRTKRIGLTLCFMSFILLSTVAAKFFIEGPGIIDKTPKSERTESAIYFFLTELIFVAFAMALFFTGITCLRKRTNAYLLRQFNQYITQSSSSGGAAPGGVGGGVPGGEFFDSPTGSSGMNSGVNNSGSVIMGGLGSSGGLHHHHHSHSGILVDRPYHHYLPAFDTHVMMNVSGLQHSRFSDGYAKPPPYHIALYLPAPDSQHSQHQISKTDGGEDSNKAHRISSGSRILGVGGTTAEPDPASFISSEASFLCEKTDESDEDDGDEESSGPERKKQRKEQSSSRPETPPPPYAQI